MSFDYSISVDDVYKSYRIYSRPQDRLLQMLRPKKKYYEDFWALRGISFNVMPGETVGIIGANGSGKSTLLQIVCGTLEATSGNVKVNGRVAPLLELGSGFNPEFTGSENVRLNASILGLEESEIDAKYESILSFADIGSFINQPVKYYSSGMYARLAFAVAVHVDPQVLIVDEILAVGDSAFQRKCMTKLQKIRDTGCSLLFVSHSDYQIKAMCQRALYLEHGMTKIFGSAVDVVDRYLIDSESISPTPCNKVSIGIEEPIQTGGFFRIESVSLFVNNRPADLMQSGACVELQMRYSGISENAPKKVSFVCNLYRHDGTYVFGTTTIMDGFGVFDASSSLVSIRFPSLPILSGEYDWRVAINDENGIQIYTEAVHVCKFTVKDSFEAVGIVNFEHSWSVSSD